MRWDSGGFVMPGKTVWEDLEVERMNTGLLAVIAALLAVLVAGNAFDGPATDDAPSSVPTSCQVGELSIRGSFGTGCVANPVDVRSWAEYQACTEVGESFGECISVRPVTAP